ncbi:MAG TPA: DUF2079 domain-containing protein, partial [Acidimicrobiales bacterium]|nr:DUF2079 domain-containing protein [Acidimicrobiales bacterium]
IRHARFSTYGFDLGIYDQATWLLSQFNGQLITVRGLNVFGHHATPILYLFAPFYRLGAGPEFLLIVQVLAQASGAVAVYLLARDRLKSRWLGVGLAGVLLFNPTYQFLAWEYFHPETLAIAPLLFAYWAARARRWGWFWVAAGLAVACKEDVALALAVLGVLIAIRGDRRVGAFVAAAAAAWYLLVTRVALPGFNHGIPPFYEGYFAEFGNSAGSVARNVVGRPVNTLQAITRNDRLDYFLGMLLPLGLLPLFALPTFLVAGPMLAINALSTFPYPRDIKYHYGALVLVGALAATVEAIAWMGHTRRASRVLVSVLLVAALATTVAWGPSPISTQFRKQQLWPLDVDSRQDSREAAVSMVPSRAAVSATFALVPHLAHRTRIYQFPTPFVAGLWGVQGENLPDPGVVQWLVLDRTQLGPEDQAVADEALLAEFVVRFSREGIVVAERRPAPS